MGRLRWISFLAILTGPTLVLAQVSYPNCSSGLNWAYNGLYQSPCVVAAYLESSCNGGQFNIPKLPDGSQYSGPTSAQFYPCECNTVVYSLVSACADCQGGNWILWSAWSSQCPSVALSTYPKSIPDHTRIPHWAYLDVVTSNNWNESASEIAGDYPEVTPTAPSIVQASSTAAPQNSSSSNSNQNNSSSNTGKIAGGVVGGVVGAALLAAFILWYLRRRRLRAVPRPSPFAEKAETFGSPDPSPSISTGKYYDPSDPSTFPKPFTSPSASVIQTTASTDQVHSIMSRPSDRSRYPGLPLV